MRRKKYVIISCVTNRKASIQATRAIDAVFTLSSAETKYSNYLSGHLVPGDTEYSLSLSVEPAQIHTIEPLVSKLLVLYLQTTRFANS